MLKYVKSAGENVSTNVDSDGPERMVPTAPISVNHHANKYLNCILLIICFLHSKRYRYHLNSALQFQYGNGPPFSHVGYGNNPLFDLYDPVSC